MDEVTKKLRKAREFTVDIGKFKFLCRRPTQEETALLSMKEATNIDICRQFVIGWEGVRNLDIDGGDSDDPAKFSKELWSEWLADHSEFWGPLNTAIMGAYSKWQEHKEDLTKN